MPAARTKTTSRTPARISPYERVDVHKKVAEDSSEEEEDSSDEEDEEGTEICGAPRRETPVEAEDDDGYDGLIFIDPAIKKAFDEFMDLGSAAEVLCECEGEKDLVKLLEDVFKAGLVKGRADAEKPMIQVQ